MAGILDVLDNYAFLRTTGYLPGPTDAYLSLGLVKKYALRKGDHVVGAIRPQRDNENSRQKYNPLVRIDKVNGLDPDKSRERKDFGKLTPLYPQARLRLEGESHNMTTRIIDLVAPIGKGQRDRSFRPRRRARRWCCSASPTRSRRTTQRSTSWWSWSTSGLKRSLI
ncbi:MAG: hypothetical protein R2687_07245 [Candidatus Nanopelagicales bacterium]